MVSANSVQLLSIGREDFFDIFMSGHGPGKIPDHILYVRYVNMVTRTFCDGHMQRVVMQIIFIYLVTLM